MPLAVLVEIVGDPGALPAFRVRPGAFADFSTQHKAASCDGSRPPTQLPPLPPPPMPVPPRMPHQTVCLAEILSLPLDFCFIFISILTSVYLRLVLLREKFFSCF